MFRSNRLEADLSGVFSLFPMKSLLSGFWIVLLGPCPDELVIGLTAISTRGKTALSISAKVVSRKRFLTVLTASSTAFRIFSSILFPMT